MFKFLKEKIGNVVKKFSKEVEDEAEIIEEETTQKTTEIEDIKTAKAPQALKTEKESTDEKSETKKEEETTDITEDKELLEEQEIENQNKIEDKINLDDEKKFKHETIEKQDIDQIPENLVVTDSNEDTDDKQNIEEQEKNEIKEKEITPKLEEEKTKKPQEQEEPKKKSFFTKLTETITKINLTDEKFEELFWDLELVLLENNVAVEIIEKIKDDLKNELTQDKISRKTPQQIISDTLKKTIEEVLDVEKINLDTEIKKHKPYIIAMIGVNGAGKTTALAKLANKLKNEGKSIVIAAADTFRAAAIQQVEEHANKLGIKLIKHDYNSDPSAVAYDAIKHAEAKGLDVVLIDTAGRLHSNDNLMQELHKIIRVNKPHLKIFVGESTTGNDCIEQAKVYDEKIGIDAIILTKADIDEKGGTAISISHLTGKPIIYRGVGQEYKDLEEFDKDKLIESLF